EYINRHVAELLNQLLIGEQTKSRSRHSNDNAQAESRNGAIVRKYLGYSHIPQHFATRVNAFCRDHLNPYINFHRPCLFAETFTDAKGRQRQRYLYKRMMTPYEKLKSLPLAAHYLTPAITFQQLDAQAGAISDNEAAQRLNDARAILFKTIFNRSKTAA
ncbi:Integrase catalytic region, partial [mine drainage metagenome]